MFDILFIVCIFALGLWVVLSFLSSISDDIVESVNGLVSEVKKIREIMEKDSAEDKILLKDIPEVKMHCSDGRVVNISANGDRTEFPDWMHK